MVINKDTKVCISIAEKAGNFGCSVHNASFKKLGLDFIYKSFSVDKENLEAAINGVRALGIRGCSVTMPHKVDVLNYVDEVSEEVEHIGACNTIVNNNGILRAYNTDAYSSYTVLKDMEDRDIIYILGRGGYAKAVSYSAKQLFKEVKMITRENWSDISSIDKGVIFNCTPVENIVVKPWVNFIDCIVTTPTGKKLSMLQASRQFFIYTKKKFPIKYIEDNLEEILL